MMANSTFQVLLFLILMLASAQALKRSMLGLLTERKHGMRKLNSVNSEQDIASDGFEMRNYTQTLDHFNHGPASYATFQQRYIISFKHWGGANTSSPIFFYLGDQPELPMENTVSDSDLPDVFLVDNAPRFKALQVFAEHRYYGESNPFGSMEVAYSNSSTLQYLTSAQALADYAELITSIKKNLSAETSPVIVVGASYCGMLAAWFRLKYPHIVIGALASSAPILYFQDVTPPNGYYNVASKYFRDTSESCYETIKSSWFEIDKIATQPNGLTTLSRMFNTCRPLNDAQDLKDELAHLYTYSAQYDAPSDNRVATLCHGIDGEAHGTSVLQKIISGLKSSRKLLPEIFPCIDAERETNEILRGSEWQGCTELVMPIGSSGNDSMFMEEPFDMSKYILDCQKLFHVKPMPHWITTEYGGHNIKKVLENFGSNIIFSNGLRDPDSAGGVLENISSSIVALVTTNGSSALDYFVSGSTEPEWLVSQQNKEVEILESWIAEYNAK